MRYTNKEQTARAKGIENVHNQPVTQMRVNMFDDMTCVYEIELIATKRPLDSKIYYHSRIAPCVEINCDEAISFSSREWKFACAYVQYV